MRCRTLAPSALLSRAALRQRGQPRVSWANLAGMMKPPGTGSGRMSPPAAANPPPQPTPPHKRPGSAADYMYSLSKPFRRHRGGSSGATSKGPSSAASSVADDLVSLDGRSVGAPDT